MRPAGSPYGSASLHAVMPFALAASVVTAAPVSFSPLRSVVLHYTPFRSIRLTVTFTFGLCYTKELCPPLGARGRSLHFISFHSVLLSSASFSPPAALVVLACAVVRAAGCHVFCIPTLLANARPAPFNNQPHESKKTRQPLCSLLMPTANCQFEIGAVGIRYLHSSHRPPCVRPLLLTPSLHSRLPPFLFGRLTARR